MELRTNGLGKRYGDEWAIHDITLELDEGIHGLLGPNGAGKSTLMQVLTTLVTPTEGAAYWNGSDVSDYPSVVREILGYLPQDFGVYPDLTLQEFLEYIAALRGLGSETATARIDEMIELTNLSAVRDRKLRTFSGGMRQRAGIAQALVNDPELLIVDEPTVGLDPEERVRFRNVLSATASDRVVILSTHIVPDIEATANTVALLDNGELVTHSDPESLASAATGDVYEGVVPREDLSDLRERHHVCRTIQQADGVNVRLLANERPFVDATPVTPTLEDAYLARIDGRIGG